MNQDKLDVTKQEMARVNIDILGISELKWTGMDDKRVWNTVVGYSLKNHRMILVHFQGKPLNITAIQVNSPITNAKEAEVEWCYEDLQDLE